MLERTRRAYGLPAMAAIALRSNAILETDAAAVLKQGHPQAVGPLSQFHLGSLAKAFTANLLETLVEEGSLTWDTGPLDIFPESKDSVTQDYNRITLQDLFRHRAGLAAFKPVGAKEFQGFPASESRADCARWVLRQPAVKRPGTAAPYSNAGPSFAAVIAERTTGLYWEQLLRQRVLAPPEIQGGSGWPAASDRGQPWGHRPSWFGPRPVDPQSPYPLPDFFRPAGDIRMNLADYGSFLRAHLAGLRGSDSLVRAATFRHLHSPLDTYGLGWGVGLIDGVLNSEHVGAGGSFLAVASIWPTKNLAAAVAANPDSPDCLKACNSALKEVFLRFAA